MSPKVTPRPKEARSSFAEFRSRNRSTKRDISMSTNIGADAFWSYVCAPSYSIRDEFGAVRPATIDPVELRVLSKASNAAGGYTVPTDLDSMISTARRPRAAIGNIAREIVTDTGAPLLLGTATSHGTGTWTAENASFTTSDETFGQVSIGAFKASTEVIVSEELAQDAIADFDQYLADEFGARVAMLEETAFAVGDGSGKPLGIAHSSSGYSVITAATGSATSFKLADVRSAYDALPVAYRPNASWVFSPSAFSSLAGLTDTAGGLVLPSLHAAKPSLYGRPVNVSPDFPATAASARSAFFGDLSLAYVVRRVRTVGMSRQDELFSNNGQIGFRLFERLDGRPLLLEAGVILRNSAT